MDRVLDENGNFVSMNRKPAEDPRDREIKVLKEQMKNYEQALKQKKDEIQSMRADLNQSNPLLKQEVVNKDKEIGKLKESMGVLLAKEKQLDSALEELAGLKKENKKLMDELNSVSKASEKKARGR